MRRFGRGRAVVAAAVFALLPAVAAGGTAAATTAPRSHVDGLIAKMTLDEKLSFVHGATDPKDLGEAGYIPGVPRLGIPELRLTDGPAGVRVREHATAMPAPVALASAFDPALALRYGAVIGRDGRALGQDVLLSPMVNTIRVPYGGRNFETFSEDPLVSSRTVAAEVRGIQSQGLIATVKHYAENNQETDRQTVDVKVDEQTMRQIELPGFQAAVDAGAGAVMCSYNKVNGDPACGNAELLNTILKEQWGFGGWVMSDWGATHSTDAITKGLDQEMPSGTYLGDALKTAIQKGTIPESALDGAVKRILGQMERFGLLRKHPPSRPSRDAAGAAQVARSVAERGAVLLRNTGNALPLSGSAAKDVAVIGPTAQTPKVTGGGSSHVTPDHAAAPIDTIRARAGKDATVTYASGGDLTGTPVPASAFSPAPPATVPAGKTTSYSGKLTVPSTGDYRLTLTADNGLAFGQVAGQTLFSGNLFGQSGVWVHLTAGTVPFTLFGQADAGKDLHLGVDWVTPDKARALIPPAVAAAKKAKTAVVFAYDDGTEGADRASLALPGYQNDLITEVAKANPNTIVVLNTGSAVKMPWLSGTRAVLDMWYPGQEGAAATTALLFGDAAPTGRLTQTFPADEDHTPVAGHPERFPGVNGEQQYSEGVEVGYRWYDKEGVKPLFPFGYGLSYTTFGYGGLTAHRVHGGLDVTVTVRNTGHRAGTAVPQVYLGASPDVTAPQAARALAGYTTVTLRPGESRQVRIHVGERQLQYWDTTHHRWSLGTGARAVWAGPSSAELPLRTTVKIDNR
ncbi:hypothetical protein GCM10023196_025330 [Actinoallomurus vinaceus]|uniref:Beta-glucosidase n=1 Tax=Actinoallomurus vinaceus TaxID=1080074 RepID=A0ABP8U7N1_9ACTN